MYFETNLDVRFITKMIYIGLCVWWGYEDIRISFLQEFETNARPSGALAGEARPCLPDLLQKYIHKIWGSEDQRIWEFWEKGFDLETPKKYTFALVEVKWVFICMDFSKIAVLFFMDFDFCIFFCGFWDIFVCFWYKEKWNNDFWTWFMIMPPSGAL